MHADLWWTRVKIDLYQKKLLRWVILSNNIASAGEPMPDQDTDPEGYATWAESYHSVEASLHQCLGGMLAVVMADPRYAALGEYGRILDRIRVIREIYADYDVSALYFEDEEEELLGNVADDSTQIHDDPKSANIHKRPAPTPSSQPNNKISKLTPASLPHTVSSSLAQSSNPSLLPSILSIPFDRVYRATSKINQQTRRVRCKAALEPDLWGARCAICGLTAPIDSGGHRTYACTSPLFAASAKESVLVKLVKKPEALMVDIGEKKGVRVCYEWNNRRTKDGRCYEKDCRAEHCCSLCLDEGHRAWDCDKREYLPELPPRPTSMVPASVNDCWRLYSGSK